MPNSTDEAGWLALLPEAVLVVRDAVVAHANLAARRLFDPWRERELRGEPACHLLPEAGDDELTPRRGRRLDGSRFAMALSTVPTTCEGAAAELLVVRDIEPELALQQRLDARQRQLLDLSGRLISFQEHERRHVARELRDEIGQCLSAIRLQFARLLRRVEQPEAVALIDSACGMTERTLGQVRSLSLLLRPPQLETLGLVAALRWHLQQQRRLFGLQIRFESEAVREPVDPDVAIAVYRIVQEALSNTLRHAQAENITVELHGAADGISVTVADDGIGFVPDNMELRTSTGPTLGLLSMRERARLLGGHLIVSSALGMGTHIAARLPYNAAPKNDKAPSDPGR